MKPQGHLYRKMLRSAVLMLVLLAGLAVPAAAQTNGDAPSDQDKAIHYSLYYENYKNAGYEDALPDLLWILDHAPGYPSNNDRNFERAVVLYDSLAARADSPEETRQWLDSALVIFDTAVPRLEAIGAEVDAFIWTRDKGRFIQSHRDALSDREAEAFEAYRAMYEMDAMRTDPYYIQIIVNGLLRDQDFGGVFDMLDDIISRRGDDERVTTIVNQSKTYILENFPEELKDWLEDQITSNPDDVTLRLEALQIYTELDYEDESLETVEVLLEMANGAAADQFDDELLKRLYREALNAYVEAGATAEARGAFDKLQELGADLKAQDYFNMGSIQQQSDNFGAARNYYRQALEVDPNFTKAKQAIPNLYATAASSCGVTTREDKAVYWLIADAYASAGMGSQAATYLKYAPNAEDIFYTDKWTVGGTTSVSYTCRGLTISGSTQVRAGG